MLPRDHGGIFRPGSFGQLGMRCGPDWCTEAAGVTAGMSWASSAAELSSGQAVRARPCTPRARFQAGGHGLSYAVIRLSPSMMSSLQQREVCNGPHQRTSWTDNAMFRGTPRYALADSSAMRRKEVPCPRTLQSSPKVGVWAEALAFCGLSGPGTGAVFGADDEITVYLVLDARGNNARSLKALCPGDIRMHACPAGARWRSGGCGSFRVELSRCGQSAVRTAPPSVSGQPRAFYRSRAPRASRIGSTGPSLPDALSPSRRRRTLARRSLVTKKSGSARHSARGRI